MKQNQPALYKDTEDYFNEFSAEIPLKTTLDKGHGRIGKREYQLHWCLDVTFREDASKARKDNSPLVLNILRKIALNLVSQAQYKRIGKKRLMFRIALEPTLFLDILFAPTSVTPQKKCCCRGLIGATC